MIYIVGGNNDICIQHTINLVQSSTINNDREIIYNPKSSKPSFFIYSVLFIPWDHFPSLAIVPTPCVILFKLDQAGSKLSIFNNAK